MPKKKTREEFIKESHEKHKGKYDYSKVEYVNSATKVCIVCPEHGEFWQIPNNHLRGKACPKCGVENREKRTSTKEEFIKKAREVHGDKYSYSKVEYVNSATKVCIICPEHGEFWQTPNNHLSGNGCSKCNGLYVPTTEEWITSAREVHGDKYDYSKVEYVNANTKVCIICPEHGEFWQRPYPHTDGSGCPKCANDANGERCRSSKYDFINKSREVHGNEYDYTKVKYVNAKTKVCIICPKHGHGEFWQNPSNHLQGKGCPKCGHIASNDSKRSLLSDFIKKAREVHGDKYDYSDTEYVGCKTKVCISCPEHGEFWQSPDVHTQGKGCPKCSGHYIPTTEEWIASVREVHGNKYDYHKVEYVSNSTKVCIICHEHGDFWQTPSSHLSGCGCPKCGGTYVPTTEEWIVLARKAHGDKYGYSKAEYVDAKTKVCIICNEHGEFWQNPSNHLQGKGCPKCSADNTRERLTLTKEEFIEKANEVHGIKYDYHKVEYVNAKTKVTIICSEHGEFEQTPSQHLSGNGCPKCNLSHLERSVMNYLDEVGIFYEYQKRFDWLGKQSLDFYLPDYNVGIECQGGQHFFPVDFAGKGIGWACEHFKYVIYLDKRKKSLCEKHDVKLLYFGNVPNYDTFLGNVVHDDVQYLIDYLNEYKIDRDKPTTE